MINFYIVKCAADTARFELTWTINVESDAVIDPVKQIVGQIRMVYENSWFVSLEVGKLMMQIYFILQELSYHAPLDFGWVNFDTAHLWEEIW